MKAFITLKMVPTMVLYQVNNEEYFMNDDTIG